tara:strand:- start:94 stop:720 length:627 start_codon:yes stop_codon:yes gene_type:complete
MNRLYKLLFFIPIIIIGCSNNETDDRRINQSINSLNMNIYSNEGIKLLSIKSPYSNFEKEENIFNLKETTINLFKDNKSEYIITSDNSKITNNNKLIELNGNVVIKTLEKKQDILHSKSFSWNIENSEFLLVGNVKFKNNSITLTSNKAILNKTNKIIEFFNPVKYVVNDSNNERGYEVSSQNAYYNIDTKSVNFRSKEDRVRTKIYF